MSPREVPFLVHRKALDAAFSAAVMDDGLAEAGVNDLGDLRDRAQAVICREKGHQAIPDHCGMPEHDYCAWCNEKTPGEAHK